MNEYKFNVEMIPGHNGDKLYPVIIAKEGDTEIVLRVSSSKYREHPDKIIDLFSNILFKMNYDYEYELKHRNNKINKLESKLREIKELVMEEYNRFDNDEREIIDGVRINRNWDMFMKEFNEIITNKEGEDHVNT